MIRLTWRQFRMQAVVGAGALAIVAVIAAVTGSHLVHVYDTSVATCAGHSGCSSITASFLQNDHSLQILLDALVVVVPGLIGIFWGAPLVARELEAGTFRLAWTQSVTRTRWLAVKLGVVGLASMVVAGLVSLMVTWWSSPLDRVNMNVFGTFDQRDLVAVGYAAFAFALGATIGTLFRRTLPAMAVALVVFVAARLTFLHWVRPQLIAPVLRTYALGPATIGGYGSTNGGPSTLVPNPPDIANAWIVSTQFVDRAGSPLTPQLVASACPHLGAGLPRGGGPGGPQHAVGPVPGTVIKTLQECATKLGATYHELVAYQPASRYWEFQWYETAIFLGGAVILSGACLWWVRRRLS